MLNSCLYKARVMHTRFAPKQNRFHYDALRSFNANLLKVRSLGFDDTFIRKWNYYLCYCEAAFAMRNINVMHLVYARPNNISR